MKKTPYKGNYKLQPTQHNSIAQMYQTGNYTTEYIAKSYDISIRQVQRIAKKLGVIRTQAEANKIAAPLKHYHHVPEHLKVKRKHISQRTRFEVISNHLFCSTCGLTVKDGIRLEVDHIDENPTNNDLSNLQVLCNNCNQGKSHSNRYS
jgi:5-methylcytosine-specific restriction endonuclease McrA